MSKNAEKAPSTIESSLDQINAIKDPQRKAKALESARLFLESLANNGSLETELTEDQRGIVEHVEYVTSGVRAKFEADNELFGFLDR